MTPDTTPATAKDPDGYDVPSEERPATCEYCGAPFSDAAYLALHRGIDHPGELTDEERAAFESAYEDENEEIRLFRLKALALLVVLYFGLLVTYALIT